MGKEIRGVFLLLLTTILWGCSFVAQRQSVDTVDAFTFNTGRMVSAFLTLLIVVLIRQAYIKRTCSETTGCSQNATGNFRTLIIGGLLCGLALFGGVACMQLGIMTTSAGKTGFITALYIIEVPLFYVVIGHKPRKILWLCVAMAIAGLWLLAVQPGTSFALQKGEIILLIGSVFFALQIMLIDHFVSKTDPLLLTLIEFAVGAVLFPIC
ncbi:MAG: DMT family transporter, partial [Lentihominibacter sp.]